jgi:acyl carrier protein
MELTNESGAIRRKQLVECITYVMSALGNEDQQGQLPDVNESARFTKDLGFDSLMLMAFSAVVHERMSFDIAGEMSARNIDASQVETVGALMEIMEI